MPDLLCHSLQGRYSRIREFQQPNLCFDLKVVVCDICDILRDLREALLTQIRQISPDENLGFGFNLLAQPLESTESTLEEAKEAS